MRDDPTQSDQTDGEVARYPQTGRFLMGRGRTRMTPEERRVLEDTAMAVKDYPARHHLVRRGEPVDSSMMLIEGYVTRYMDDREGYRQLVSVHVPGDFVDLHGFPTGRLDHDIGTLGPVKVALFDHQALVGITERHPTLTRFLWFATLIDAAMHREWIFRLGRLGAEGRLAHLFCELYARLEMVGLAQDGQFDLPLTQPDLAEACGLTGVHVNRTLRTLRERGLLTFKNGRVEILDHRGLCTTAEFNSDYLYSDCGVWKTS
ncbi:MULTISPECIES: Crp/Fnr family transcriptional regulator [Sphingomonas]|uniref:Crp/Fnr family transcriptional regulator n=1 Tax=Sphingomonas kyungheensis TaxID=1069987 RepID=A0ABU8H1C0_9SPHN|nr:MULTISPECIES: Crp/Fnr family transcriptional regulator [unclassified Sphingomonas]EZP57502.1 Cyclic nucleotide-binding domain protein [Sphingomonas sp. RIT328]